MTSAKDDPGMTVSVTSIAASVVPQDHKGTLSRPRNRTWPPLPVILLLATLVMPWVFSIGSLAISPYRLVLMALLVPSLARWISGKAGKIRAADILILLFCLWCIIALTVVHGLESALETGGMNVIETAGAYFVARCYIRSVGDFRATAKLLFILIVLLLPLAIAEAVSGEKWTLRLFRLVGPTIVDGQTELRWSLTRVQGPVEHPILFGVLCGAPLAYVFLAGRGQLSLVQRGLMALLVGVTAMLSLSSGPIVGVAIQVALLCWNGLLRPVAARWRLLWFLAVAAYLVLEIPSSQSVPQMLTRFAFDPWTAFYRLLIFDYGWQSVLAHPLFGTGFGEWLRPPWMGASIDMFWLVPAVRHGLPAGVLCGAAFFAATIVVAKQPGLDAARADCRTAYLIALTALFCVGWTVHFWNATYVMFMFMLGSGLWLCDSADAVPEEVAPGKDTRTRRPLDFSRRPQELYLMRRPPRKFAREA